MESPKEKGHKFTQKASIALKFHEDHGQHLCYPFVFFIQATCTLKWNYKGPPNSANTCFESHPMRLYSPAALLKPLEDRLATQPKTHNNLVTIVPIMTSRGLLGDIPMVWVTWVVNKASFNGSRSKCLQSLAALNSFSGYKWLE